MLRLLYFCSLCALSYSYIINYEKTKVLTGEKPHDYFGYKLLLQKGNTPIIIIAAPKGGVRSNGVVYRCNLNNLKCQPYNTQVAEKEGIHVPNKTGFFLGADINGDHIAGNKLILCAPRYVTTNYLSYMQKGRCFLFNNSTNVDREPDLIFPMRSVDPISAIRESTSTVIHYYNGAFAQAGFSVQYDENTMEFILGAPGISKWNGAVVVTTLSGHNQVIQDTNLLYAGISDEYLGYTVGSGKFIESSSETWYVAGAPRGSSLFGQVNIYEDKLKGKRLYHFDGDELGSYFGASLLVVRKKRGGDDLLVGAPMHSGGSWEEGRVYFYKNNLKGYFAKKIILQSGNPQSGARFGTTIADLGDIDLDSYPDIAIGAPYEDDGTGAVYIFYGNAQGFASESSVRITPSLFQNFIPNKISIRGFGGAISKGNDMDGNFHNDFGVGAFQSSTVFFFTSYDIIDVDYKILPSLDTIYTITQIFNVTFCLSYAARNRKTERVPMFASFNVDDERVLTPNVFNKSLVLEGIIPKCFNDTIKLKTGFVNTEPLVLKLDAKLDRSTSNNVWFEEKEKTLQLPVIRGCGNKVICQVDIAIHVDTDNLQQIIFGVDKELKIFVRIENSGDPAFDSQLHIDSSNGVSLINLRECIALPNGSYTCNLNQITRESPFTKIFTFDLSGLQPELEKLLLKFSVTTSEPELNPGNNEVDVIIPVVLKNSPYLDGHSKPDAIVWDQITDKYEVIHDFTIGNEGPGPAKINFTAFVPQVFEIEVLEDKGLDTECHMEENVLMNTQKNIIFDISPPSNISRIVSCLTEDKCTKIVCFSNNFFYSNPITISVKMLLYLRSDKFGDAESVVLESIGILNNVTPVIYSAVYTTVHGLLTNKPVPLWIYIVSIIPGLLLLALIVFILYKLNFFRRTYKEKLQNEQDEMILGPGESESETVFD